MVTSQDAASSNAKLHFLPECLTSGLLLALRFSASDFQGSPRLPLHFPGPSKATQLVAGQLRWLCLGPISCGTDNRR